ncbi:DNA (cytosine-5-)-methyltransferase [Flavobacterium sp. ASW18X]|uniref:DNA (cytosine-5-)-methyltransferase n=1 Tax=Flavobacterium sp. ASW18X TaxID=2572595 RepID=UPI0010ADD571|nr:DNA (cytosine-5-)-methyltransferase [Flavobacterium sp. ASW18X]TKD65135.1 DNA (cytosine-5-)-methyltransferase [Flavobacterium sp. ASW18X]
MRKLKVCELFAGVGGFRLGLEATNGFEVIWSNQWEPATKLQHASEVYKTKFRHTKHSNQDIETVATTTIPDHDVLVGGFPCQDYSVASTLKSSKGLLGKKGVLWWSIYRILEEKVKKPQFLILENVDRLLKSPVKQRGRDFAVMLSGLSNLGYAVEWRVINAAEYGMPQRRRRVFFVGIHKESSIYKQLEKQNSTVWLSKHGILAKSFPIHTKEINYQNFKLENDLVRLSEQFNLDGKLSPFKNAGICFNHHVCTANVSPNYKGPYSLLQDILQNEDDVSQEFYIPETQLQKWNYLKGAKKETRRTKAGFSYQYTEGNMTFPDALDKPSRTIITGEGGAAASRFKHVIQTTKGLRRLTPIELERLNMFPDNHTKLKGITDAKRAFFMGNALVIGIVEKIGKTLLEHLKTVE